MGVKGILLLGRTGPDVGERNSKLIYVAKGREVVYSPVSTPYLYYGPETVRRRRRRTLRLEGVYGVILSTPPP